MSVQVRMSVLKDIAVEASHYGVSIMELCKSVGFSLEDLQDVERWVGLEKASAVWKHAIRLSGDLNLGLRIGQNSNPYVVGIVGYLMESSPDLGTAIQQLCNFNAVFADMFSYEYELSTDYFKMQYVPATIWWERYPDTARQAIETSMSRTLAIIHRFTGKKVYPLKAHFNYTLSSEKTIYQQVLKTDLRFSQNENALYFPIEAWHLAVVSHNHLLFQHFEQLATAKLGSIQEEE